MKTIFSSSFTNPAFSSSCIGVDRFRLLWKGWSVKVLSLLLVVIVGGVSWGQVTIAGWDMSAQSNYGSSPLSATTTASNTTIGNLTKGVGFATGGTAASRAWGYGTLMSAATTTNNSTAVVNNSFFSFTVKSNTGYALSLSSLSTFDYRRSGTGAANGLLQYQINSGSFVDIGIINFVNSSSSGGSIGSTDLSAISELQNLPSSSTVTIRCVLYNGNTGGTWYIFDKSNTTANDFVLSGTVSAISSSPTISASGTLGVVNTTYGTASATPTSFSVSGSNMSAGISINPPAGFQVSTVSDFSSNVGANGSPITVGAAGTIASTTVYVRLAASTVVGSYSGNIVLSSSGASSVNVATVSSTVSKKALTITADNQTVSYGTSAATVTSNGSYTVNGFVNSENSSVVTGSVTYTSNYTSSTNAGTNAATITPIVTGLSATNYSFTAVNGNISVTAIVASAPNISTITAGSQQLSVAFTAPSSNGGATLTNYQYSIDGGTNWITRSPAATTSPLVITTLTNGQAYNIVIRAVNSAGSGASSNTVSGTPVAQPAITTSASTLSSAMTTTYGTASSTRNFTVSGVDLTGDLTLSAPTGLEISLASNSGFTSSLVLSPNSNIVSSTTIYTRIAATSNVGTYNSISISISGGSATTKTVSTTTSGNSVAAIALTISGLTASNKVYDGGTSVTINGSPAYSGLMNGESFSVVGTPTWLFTTKTVGTNKSITQSGSYDPPSSNYTVTQPTLTANITAISLSVLNATVTSKTYDGTTSATLSGSLSGVISPDVVTFNGTGTFTSANVGTGVSVTSTSTLSGADASNYTLTQPTGLSGEITKANQTISFNSLPGKSTLDAPFTLSATSTSGLTVSYTSSNSSVATISGTLVTIVGPGTTTITASQSGNNNYNAASNALQDLIITQIIVAWDFYNQSSPGTLQATISNSSLTNASNGNNLTRGAGAPVSSGGSSFRTTGFQNNGINVTNTDYFQIKLTSIAGYNLSLTSIDAQFIGTSSFYASPGVTSQFAYSLDSINFTLIGSPQTSTSLTLTQINLSSIAALQNVSSGTTVFLRYYASGQTSTGGWGFSSPTSGSYGLKIGGSLSCSTPAQPSTITGNTSVCTGSSQTYSVTAVSGVAYTWSLPNNSTGSSSTNSISSTIGSAGSGTITVTPYNSASGCSSYTGTSRSLAVTVNPLPTVSATTSQTVCNGASVTLNGGGASSYSWTGGISNNTPFNATATTSYTVTGTDANGCTNTASSTVTVNPSTNITTQPAGYTILATGTSPSALTVTASGTNLTYQWYSNTVNSTTNATLITSATNASYTPPATAGAMYYFVIIHGDCGSDVTSNLVAVVISDSYTWNGSVNTDWNTAANWTPAGVPPTTAVVSVPNCTNDPLNGSLTIASGGSVTLASGTMLTLSGIITNNGTLTIESGATLVQTGSGTNAGNGTYNVKQTVSGSGGSTPNGRFWYLGGAVSDAASTALLTSNGNQLWQWNESSFSYATVASGQALTQGKSYVLRSGQANETINFTGSNLSNGTVTVSGLTRTGTTQTYRGCHLISNPYPSYLDWNSVTKTNIGTTMYVRTASGSTLDVLETYNSANGQGTNISGPTMTQYIAPMQGFWVKVAADGQTGSLTMNNSMRSHQSSGSGLRSSAIDFPAYLRFNMIDGQNKDQVILLMSPDATMSLDAFDSEKMPASGYGQFYSTVNAKKLVINGMKNVKAKTSVPLTLELPTSKSYTFQAEEFNIEDGLILLEDKQEGIIQDLTINPTYSFFGNAGTNATRFVVHFQLASAPVLVGGPQELENLGMDQLSTDNIQITSNNQGTVIIRLDEGFKPEGSIRIFDANGRLVEQRDFNDQETTIQLNEQAGMYFVEVSAGKLMVKKKIVIN